MEKTKCNEAYKCIHKSLQSPSWELCAPGELLPSSVFSAFERGQHNDHHLQSLRSILVPARGPGSNCSGRLLLCCIFPSSLARACHLLLKSGGFVPPSGQRFCPLICS